VVFMLYKHFLILLLTIFYLSCSDDPTPTSSTPTDNETTGTVTDIDGNVYQTIRIGYQWWMAENLKVTHYSNGDTIPNVTDDATWLLLTTGAWCNYNNDPTNVAIYGRLYNWYAVNDSSNIAPVGWHVPSDEEWKQLEMFLGMSKSQVDAIGGRGTDEGGKMKSTGTIEGGDGLWYSPNTGATNSSGFSALPGGYGYGGSYYQIGYFAEFWSSTDDGSSHAGARSLSYDDSGVSRSFYGQIGGYSVRCVRD
jgi:uncharacterized protein (TIGR02145 family)